MKLDLTGKTALVCGGSQGIGEAIAIELANLGAKIILVARNSSNLEKVASKLKGENHRYLALDFNNLKDLKSLVATLEPIQILINNSGGPAPGTLLESQPEAFLTAFSQHILASQLLVQGLVAGMKAAVYGRIINIISTSVKQPIAGLGVSNTVRGAMASWAKTLATELAPFGITVNNVLPGFTQTGRLENIVQSRATKNQLSVEQVKASMMAQVPAGRFAQPEEIAAVVAFLASPSAAYITGINLPVDGGRLETL